VKPLVSSVRGFREKGITMKLTSIVAAVALAAVPAAAYAAKATKADAQKVVKLISADKAKTKTYCDMAKLGDEAQEAEQKKDNKKLDELAKKMDDMGKQLGPEYVALMQGMQDIDPDSKESKDIGEVLEGLDKLCGS
jgi:hypothetical protein